MMRLPARLTTKMAKVRIAQIFSSAPPRFLLHGVDPEEVLHPGSHAPVSRERMRGLIADPAPVIWIGGSEPLVHPGIGHFARAIGHGHYVFLETDGTLLCRRIHEFQPLPHWVLGDKLGIIDIPRGVKISGSRFYVLKGAGAALQRALIAYMLDLHVQRQCLFELGHLRAAPGTGFAGGEFFEQRLGLPMLLLQQHHGIVHEQCPPNNRLSGSGQPGGYARRTK